MQVAFLNGILPIAQQKLLDWFQKLISSESAEAKSIGDSIDSRTSLKLAEFHQNWNATCYAMLATWKEWHEKLTESILRELADSRKLTADTQAMWEKVAWGIIRLLAVMTVFWAGVRITQVLQEKHSTVVETQLRDQAQAMAMLRGQVDEATKKLKEAEQEKARLNLLYGQDGSIWAPVNSVRLPANDRHPDLYQVAPPNR